MVGSTRCRLKVVEEASNKRFEMERRGDAASFSEQLSSLVRLEQLGQQQCARDSLSQCVQERESYEEREISKRGAARITDQLLPTRVCNNYKLVKVATAKPQRRESVTTIN